MAGNGSTNSLDEFFLPHRQALTALKYVLIVVGSIGNILIITIMSNRRNRDQPTSIVFLLLAVIDLCTAWFGFLTVGGGVLSPFIDPSVFEAIYGILRKSSIWTLVVISFERVLCLYRPFEVREICTRKAVIACEIAIAAFAIIHDTICFFYLTRFAYSPWYGRKVMVPNVPYGIQYVQYSQLAIDFIVPFINLIVSSVFIIYKIRKLPGNSQERDARSDSVTRILLSANILFFVTNVPIKFMNIPALGYFYYSIPVKTLGLVLMWSAFLYQLNSALNFYVYILSGKKFRNDTKEIIIEIASPFVKRCRQNK